MKVTASTIAGFLSLINDTDTTFYVQGRAVEPGGSRDLPATEAMPYLDPEDPQHAPFLPHAAPPAPTAEEIEANAQERERAEQARREEERAAEELEQKRREAAEAAGRKVLELLATSVENIKGSFPVLADDELVALQTAEQAKGDGARKTLMEALAGEIADRELAKRDPAAIGQ